MRMGKNGKLAAALGLCFIFLVMGPFSSDVRALGRPEGMDDLTWTNLQDNVIDFEELENLVKYYNPSYQQLLGTVTPMVDAGKQTAAQMQASEELKTMKESEKELKKTLSRMDPNSVSPADQMAYQQTYMMYQAMEAGIQGTEQGIRAIRRASGTIESQTRDLRTQTLYSLTAAVQQMFIGYNQALASRDLCVAAEELSEAALRSAETQRSVGMATDNDVLSAQQALLSAQNQISSLDSTLSSLRQNLYLMTGWNYDASAEVGTVPAPDLTRIEAMNPAVDITRAVDNSYSLKTLDDTLKGSLASHATKEQRKAEAREEIRTQLETLYQTVLADRTAYEAASTTLESARLAEESSRRQYELGMIGQLQYLQARISSLQQKMAADNASLSLVQAILDYEWALRGILMSGQAEQ